jgi:hypothetical protein
MKPGASTAERRLVDEAETGRFAKRLIRAAFVDAAPMQLRETILRLDRLAAEVRMPIPRRLHSILRDGSVATGRDRMTSTET